MGLILATGDAYALQRGTDGKDVWFGFVCYLPLWCTPNFEISYVTIHNIGSQVLLVSAFSEYQGPFPLSPKSNPGVTHAKDWRRKISYTAWVTVVIHYKRTAAFLHSAFHKEYRLTDFSISRYNHHHHPILHYNKSVFISHVTSLCARKVSIARWALST